MPPRMRSADALGLTMAVSGSVRVKVAKRLERLRSTPPRGFLWGETAEEFGRYRDLFPKPERICVACRKAGRNTVTTWSMEVVDGWGSTARVVRCLIHGANPKTVENWSIGKAERRVYRAAEYVRQKARAAHRNGTIPRQEATWGSLLRQMTVVYAFVKNRGVV